MSEYVDIPKGVQQAAKRGLELRREYGRGGTEVGLRTARRLARGGRVRKEFARKVGRYFPRHAGDRLDKKDPPSNGWIAWLLWGGDAGWRWGEGVMRQRKSNPSKTYDVFIQTDLGRTIRLVVYARNKREALKKAMDYAFVREGEVYKSDIREKNPALLDDVIGGVAMGTGFGIASAVTTPLVVGGIEKAKKAVKRRAQVNPESAEGLFEEFHGRESQEELLVGEEEKYRDDLAVLGELRELVVVDKPTSKTGVPVQFDGDDNVMLASTPSGNQYLFVGGNQELDLREFGVNGKKDKVSLGWVYSITYYTDKQHLSGPKEAWEYEHKFGEEGGELPMLVYDRMNERMELVGGSYKTTGRGIED